MFSKRQHSGTVSPDDVVVRTEYLLPVFPQPVFVWRSREDDLLLRLTELMVVTAGKSAYACNSKMLLLPLILYESLSVTCKRLFVVNKYSTIEMLALKTIIKIIIMFLSQRIFSLHCNPLLLTKTDIATATDLSIC